MKENDFFERNLKEATDPTIGTDEMNTTKEDDEMPVTRVDLLQHVMTWIYDTSNFRYKYTPSEDEAGLEDVLSAFRELYSAEPVHTIEIKRECLRRAYWDVCRPAELKYNTVEMALMLSALELMKSARFKKTMKAIGADIDEDEMAWYAGWVFASHYVLNGSEKVTNFIRNCKDTLLEVDEEVDEPMFESSRIYEMIEKSGNPHSMLDLLGFPGLFDDEEERKLNKRWLESRLI